MPPPSSLRGAIPYEIVTISAGYDDSTPGDCGRSRMVQLESGENAPIPATTPRPHSQSATLHKIGMQRMHKKM